MDHFLLVDTGPWVGFFAEQDQYHTKSVETFLELKKAGREFLITNHILSEVVTRIRMQGTAEAAGEVWKKLEQDQLARVFEVPSKDRQAGRAYMEKYSDLELSLVDCTSMAVLKSQNIQEIFTFDRDFVRAGFRVVP